VKNAVAFADPVPWAYLRTTARSGPTPESRPLLSRIAGHGAPK